MKIIWVILIFMVMFNIMVTFTSSLGIFQVTNIDPSLDEADLEQYSEYGTGGGGLLGIVGLEVVGGTTAIAALIGGLIAVATHSYVPLVVGAFIGFMGSALANAYTIFTANEIAIPHYFLIAGTVGMGILLIATLFEMGTGGQNV